MLLCVRKLWHIERSEMTDLPKKSKKPKEVAKDRFEMRLSTADEAGMKILEEKLAMKRANIVRMALSDLAAQEELKLPEGAFEWRPGGNWTDSPRGKENGSLMLVSTPVVG
jgi:hypothetical protein